MQWGTIIATDDYRYDFPVIFALPFNTKPILTMTCDYNGSDAENFGSAPTKGSVTATGFKTSAGNTSIFTCIWYIAIG